MNKPISKKLAKLLKQFGCDIECTSYYDGLNIYVDQPKFDYNVKTIGDTAMHIRNAGYYAAPIIADVIMWIYDKYEIWIICDATVNLWYYTISIPNTGKMIISTSDKSYASPEEAYEAAIEYTLKNLI